MTHRYNKVTLEEGQFGWDYILRHADGRTVLIQNDWNYPGVAGHMGWVPCKCGETDGTIDCKHHTAHDMINSEQEFLDDHIGDEFEDPGYFA